jgi:hypothetical protein
VDDGCMTEEVLTLSGTNRNISIFSGIFNFQYIISEIHIFVDHVQRQRLNIEVCLQLVELST